MTDGKTSFFAFCPMIVKCPVCGVPKVWEGNSTRPFCSKQCRLIDLGAWASEQYRVPTDESVTSFSESEDQSQNE